MSKKAIPFREASAQGAVATGAQATGAAATGSLGIGALAVGAAAVGALAIGRLFIGRARIGRMEIGELIVGKFRIGAEKPGAVTIVTRIRAAAGKGNGLERLLVEEAYIAGVTAGSLRRSAEDADLFVFEQSGDVPGSEQDRWLEAVRRRAVAEGLIAGAVEDAVVVERLTAVAFSVVGDGDKMPALPIAPA